MGQLAEGAAGAWSPALGDLHDTEEVLLDLAALRGIVASEVPWLEAGPERAPGRGAMTGMASSWVAVGAWGSGLKGWGYQQ